MDAVWSLIDRRIARAARLAVAIHVGQVVREKRRSASGDADASQGLAIRFRSAAGGSSPSAASGSMDQPALAGSLEQTTPLNAGMSSGGSTVASVGASRRPSDPAETSTTQPSSRAMDMKIRWADGR